MFCLHFREDGEGVSWELGYSLGLSIFLKDVQIKKDEISFIQTAIYSEFHKPQHIQTPVDSIPGTGRVRAVSTLYANKQAHKVRNAPRQPRGIPAQP